MTDNFKKFAESVRPQTGEAPEQTVRDDPAQANGYRAIRRVRTFQFPDVWFIDHTGAGHAFQWAFVRQMVKDGRGTRLSLIWPDGEVTLTGRHLDKLEEDIQRRIVSEFFQIMPGQAGRVPEGEPVITTMRIVLGEETADAIRPPGIALVVPDES